MLRPLHSDWLMSQKRGVLSPLSLASGGQAEEQDGVSRQVNLRIGSPDKARSLRLSSLFPPLSAAVKEEISSYRLPKEPPSL